MNFSIDLDRYVSAAQNAPLRTARGRVQKVVGQLIEIEGVEASIGSELVVEVPSGKLRVEAIGFRGEIVVAAPLGSTAGIAPGARVHLGAKSAEFPMSDALLGRVIDAFGRPLDGRPLSLARHAVPLHAPPPPPFGRRAVDTPFETGVRAIDALLPLGRGQRIGLFAGTGVGKSTLLGMMCKAARADVVVVGLIGERGREVGDFVRTALGPEGLARSVVVAATGDAPPWVRVRGALAATSIAEHFRAQGLDVLLVMDSVTRFAMALREASLAAGEPPLTKGYTPSVFAALPSLLERAGRTDGEGSITAIYTVLVEGDDLQDPIADAVRGVLDGHIVLSRSIADRGLYPAIDVQKSISRLAFEIVPKTQMTWANRVRDLLAAYDESIDLVRLGAYVPGSDPRVDKARAAMPEIEALVKQAHDEHIPRETSVATLRAFAEKFG